MYYFIGMLIADSKPKCKLFSIRCDNYSRAETNQGRKLLIIRRFLPRKLFK